MKATIALEVEQATSIEQFRQPSGRRDYGKLYFQRAKDTMIPECVGDHTNVQELIKKIELGIIYIQAN
jgi:hypothetical protein